MRESDSAAFDSGRSVQLQDESSRHADSLRSSHVPPRTTSRRLAPLNSNCFVCGAYNPNGLHLTFDGGSSGVEATWVPNEAWESFRGTVHGGIITAVLDEAMSKAIIVRGWEAFTAELKLRFRTHISPGERLHVRGWIVERHKRRILTEATLLTEIGAERAHAWATFLVPRDEPTRE